MGTPDVIEMPIAKYKLNFAKKVVIVEIGKREVLPGGNDEQRDVAVTVKLDSQEK